MSGLFLTSDELHELTGYRLPKWQVAWLKKRAWRFETNAAGAPRVARAYLEAKLVGKSTSEAPSEPARHNFNALRLVK